MVLPDTRASLLVKPLQTSPLPGPSPLTWPLANRLLSLHSFSFWIQFTHTTHLQISPPLHQQFRLYPGIQIGLHLSFFNM